MFNLVWLLTFEQILKGEVDMFNYIDEYESARWIDPLSRIDEDEIPMMMRFSSAQDDQGRAVRPVCTLGMAYLLQRRVCGRVVC